MVSFWAIAIKTSLGKLSLSRGVESLEADLAHDGMFLLSIRSAHCAGVVRLPFHHRDPFDRLLKA
jgi:PIN domain nuclease of toxin-antitoxin system